MKRLSDDLCDQLSACYPAVDHIVSGSRRSITRSPDAVWDPWSVSDEAGSKLVISDAYLAGIVRIHAHLAGLQGATDREIEILAAGLRYGHDVGQGTGLVGVMNGSRTQDRFAESALSLAVRDGVSVEDLWALYREIVYVNRNPLNMRDLLEAEYIAVGALWVGDEDAVIPPGGEYYAQANPTRLWEKLSYNTGDEQVRRTWSSMIEIQRYPYPGRVIWYRSRDANRKHWDLEFADLIYRKYDTSLAAGHSRMLMLQIAVADSLLQLERGVVATVPADLLTIDPELPIIDPLGNEAYIIVSENGQRRLISTAINPANHPDLMIDSSSFQDDLPSLELVLRAPASEQVLLPGI